MARVELRVAYGPENAGDKFQEAVGRLAEAMGVQAMIKAGEHVHAEKPIPMIEGIGDKYRAEFEKLLAKLAHGLLSALGIKAHKADNDLFKIDGQIFWDPTTGTWLTADDWAMLNDALQSFLGENAAALGYRMASEGITSGIFAALLASQGRDPEDVSYQDAQPEISDDFQRYLAEHKLAEDQFAASMFNLSRTADYCTDMADKTRSEVKAIMRQATSERWPTWRFEQKLFDELADKSKDWNRIARTEIADAHVQGYLERTAVDAEKGEAVYYIGRSAPDACPVCLRDIDGVVARYVDDPNGVQGGEPDPHAEAYIWAGKTSVGHGAKESYFAIPRHPHCGCRLARHFPKSQKVNVEGEEN